MGCGSSHEQGGSTARGAVKKSSTLGRSRTDRSIVRQSLSKINIGISEEDVDERDLDYEAVEGLEWAGEVRARGPTAGLPAAERPAGFGGRGRPRAAPSSVPAPPRD